MEAMFSTLAVANGNSCVVFIILIYDYLPYHFHVMYTVPVFDTRKLVFTCRLSQRFLKLSSEASYIYYVMDTFFCTHLMETIV